MNRTNNSRWFVGIAVAVAFLTFIVTGTPASAAKLGLEVDPLAGGFDTTYTITASGFQPNETIDTWVGVPSLNAVGTGERQADASGYLSYDFKPKTNYGSGEYVAVLRGRASGEVSFKFYVDAVPFKNDNPPAPVTEPKPQPISNVTDRTLKFSGTGFHGGELVSTWFQYPNGTVQGWSNYYSDAWGNVSFDFTVGTNWIYGGYRLVARGTRSGNTAYVEFSYFGSISSVVASKPIQNPTPYYDFDQGGFRGGERVSVWIRFPNGTTQNLGIVTANGNGNIHYHTVIGPTWLYGQYTIAAYGWTSKATKWQAFSYFGSVNRTN